MRQMTIALACLAIFLLLAVLMATGRLPALLALPIMAVAVALVGGVPAPAILSNVLGEGALKLNAAYTTTMVGAMLAQLTYRLGIAKRLVRFAAEFSGDSPFLLALSLTGLTALLFTTLGGLGAVIMVGTLVLPVLVSLGIPTIAAGCLFLMGINLGGLFNLGNWVLYMQVLGLDQDTIRSFVLPFAGIFALVMVGFLAMELGRERRGAAIARGGAGLGALGLGAYVVMPHLHAMPWLWHAGRLVADGALVAGAIGVLVVFALRGLRQDDDAELPAVALLTPFVPLILVLAYRWDILPAFMAGLAYGVLTTWRRGAVNQLTQAIFEGVSTVVPAVVLIMGIGMLLDAVMSPQVSGAITPLLSRILPSHAVPYVVTFALLAPFSLYRGPLSLWGMGSGLVGAILKTDLVPGAGVMGMLLSVGQVQGISDPTNTQNVWVANYLNLETRQILLKTLPYAWTTAILGLVLSAIRYMPR